MLVFLLHKVTEIRIYWSFENRHRAAQLVTHPTSVALEYERNKEANKPIGTSVADERE